MSRRAGSARTTSAPAMVVVMAVAVSLLTAGCGSRPETGGSDDQDLASASAHRSRQVAAAWDGSAAAAEWRSGYHPMAEVVQPPHGGLRGRADRRAYRERNFVLRGELPATWPKTGRVTWSGSPPLTRPLTAPAESYETLAGARVGDAPHLTVTGVEPGTMSLVTSRGPATVPAWLLTLDGYDSPLRLAAALPSELPASPIRPDRDLPGQPLRRLTGIAADGRSVTVVALHGVCDDGPAVDVLETAGSAVLSALVKSREDGGTCTKQGKLEEVTVKLARPLGDRVLLDAHTGRPIAYR
ncbi:hypothetical protein ACFV6E_42395 [Streptomyces sp. NPDC059785]|uniref:hypothetical protein n=1 Tax=Streptomyces sp. NPDC059785 TaxID=3346945 RepID=UPI00366500C9